MTIKIPTLDELVEKMKADVLNYMEQGYIPKTAASYSELDSHIDANTLGGLCEDAMFDALWAHFHGTVDGAMPDAMFDFIESARSQIDTWLKERAASAPVPVETEDDCRIYAMTAAEHDTVLAALRYYQRDLGTLRTSGVHSIATNNGEHEALGADDIDQLCEDLNHIGLTFGDIVGVMGEDESDPYVAAAREHHLLSEGTLEVDLPAVVSPGEDGGAYVMAWLWIDKPEGETSD